MLNITLRQMRAVLAIAAEGKIVSAAKFLGLTAPAVTLQLKQVEEEIGVRLFDRTAQGMRRTTAGEIFLDAAQQVLDRVERLDAELAAVRSGRLGNLRVGMVPSAHYLAPQISEAFSRAYPQIALDLIESSRPLTMHRLKNHEVDLVMTARPPRDIAVRAMPFAEYHLVMEAHPAHALAGRTDIGKAELIDEHFIVREPGSGPRLSIDSYLAASRARPALAYAEMTSNAAIKQAVMADLGIAFVATHTVAHELKAGMMVTLDVIGLPLRRQWFAISLIDRSLSPAMTRFHDFLLSYGTQFLDPNDAAYAHD